MAPPRTREGGNQPGGRGDRDGATANLDRVSETLEEIYYFYAQTMGGESMMPLGRFQKMCLDASIVDILQTKIEPNELTSAQVDLIFKRTLFKDVVGGRPETVTRHLDSTCLMSPEDRAPPFPFEPNSRYGRKDKEREREAEEQIKKQRLNACKKCMTLVQFMDAIVMLATTKYPHLEKHPRDAIGQLFQEHFATFSCEQPLISDDWISVMEYAAAPLYQIYVHYFPLELNPHYQVMEQTRDKKGSYSVSMARSAARKALNQLVEDYELAPQYSSRTADCSHALRHAFAHPVPKLIVETIRLPFAGKVFTYHHFLVMLQALANVLKGPDVDLLMPLDADGGHRKAPRDYWYSRQHMFSPRSAVALRVLLTNMDTTRRPQAPALQIMAEEDHTQTLAQVEIPNDPQDDVRKGMDKDVAATVQQVFEFYVTLGEPLAKHMSIRKFNRFLRDAGLVARSVTQSTDAALKAATASSIYKSMEDGEAVAPQKLGDTVEKLRKNTVEYSLSKAPVETGLAVEDARKGNLLTSPTKALQWDAKHSEVLSPRSIHNRKATVNSGVVKKQDGELARMDGLDRGPVYLRKDHRVAADLPIATSARPITQVQADMIFLQCKHGKLTYSPYPGQQEEGFDFRQKPKGQGLSRGAGWYKADPPAKTNKLHVDVAAFTRALELVAEKAYPEEVSVPATAQEKRHVFQHLCEEVLDLLREALSKPLSSKGARPQLTSWEDDPTQRSNVEAVMTQLRAPLERVYEEHLLHENPGLSTQNFMQFTDDFGVLKEIKLLTVQRTFLLLADAPTPGSSGRFMTLEPFCRSIVYLALAAIDGPYQPHEKLLLLGHLMNGTPGAVRIAHTRDLFPVADKVREIQGPLFNANEKPSWGELSGKKDGPPGRLENRANGGARSRGR